jgi:SpoVK/Ycf46/Vps4 family AAA+-type ATPase
VNDEHFKVKSVINFDDVKVGDVVPTSDFGTLTPGGKFVQLEYVEEENKKREPYKIKPGLFTIKRTMAGLKLEETSFIHDQILPSFSVTKEIVRRYECFRRNLHKYRARGIEVPKRSMLLFGPPGNGKSTALTEISKLVVAEGRTCCVLWPTDKFEAHQVKDFVKTFDYTNVDMLVMFIEDLGGVEIDQARIKSDAALLSILDNREKTFKVPVFIIATTNFPENFLGNITNRPGRFDDKLEVPYPNAENRRDLLRFFSKGDETTAEDLELIMDKKYHEFTPAHIQDIFFRMDVYEVSFKNALDSIAADIASYNSGFSKRKKVGIGHAEEF